MQGGLRVNQPAVRKIRFYLKFLGSKRKKTLANKWCLHWKSLHRISNLKKKYFRFFFSLFLFIFSFLAVDDHKLLPYLEEGSRLTMPRQTPPGMRSVLNKCWDFYLSKRPVCFLVFFSLFYTDFQLHKCFKYRTKNEGVFIRMMCKLEIRMSCRQFMCLSF